MTTPTVALPLVNGISNRICFLLIEYMTEHNVWMSQVFNSAQYAYLKDDLMNIQRPAVFAYPLYGTKDSFSDKYIGKIILELHFDLRKQRTTLAHSIIEITELILLVNLNQLFTQYLQQFMYGLFWFGKYFHPDYSKVYSKESIVKIEFDYKIDLLGYVRGLEAAGYDTSSPDEQIYFAAEKLKANIALLDQGLEPVIVI